MAKTRIYQKTSARRARRYASLFAALVGVFWAVHRMLNGRFYNALDYWSEEAVYSPIDWLPRIVDALLVYVSVWVFVYLMMDSRKTLELWTNRLTQRPDVVRYPCITFLNLAAYASPLFAALAVVGGTANFLTVRLAALVAVATVVSLVVALLKTYKSFADAPVEEPSEELTLQDSVR